VGAFLSVGLALTGMGAMSLAIGRVTGTILAAVLFIRYSPSPLRFGFDRLQARHLLKFGLPLAGSSIIVFAVGYADQLTAGAMLGTTALGYYVLAFNLARGQSVCSPSRCEALLLLPSRAYNTILLR